MEGCCTDRANRLILAVCSQSMPRARAHVVDLMESFMSTQQAIKDLEQQIEEVSTMAPTIHARSVVEFDTILGL
jgi:hypothetical protein